MRSNYPLDIYFQHSFLQCWNVFFAIYIRRLRRLFLRLVFVSVVSRLYPVLLVIEIVASKIVRNMPG